MIVKLPVLTCQRCGWQFTPRPTTLPESTGLYQEVEVDVRLCPNRKCHSVTWDRPRKETKGGK